MTIPRITAPIESKSPGELIPSLIPHASPFLSCCSDSLENSSESPLNTFSSNKVHFTRFTWDAPDYVFEDENDIWIRKA